LDRRDGYEYEIIHAEIRSGNCKGRKKHRSEYNIKIILIQIVWKVVDWIMFSTRKIRS